MEEVNGHKKNKRILNVIKELQRLGKYNEMVNLVRKEVDAFKPTATLTEKYNRACMVIEKYLANQDTVVLESIINSVN
ncbi:hypothetical protein NEPAR06_1371 [Nematocida parisii]|uniref:Uncharacterized protein n=1 Tax=Nematocida parisii (strain ERTm3) TaxID=935791 RepID=I3EKC5_NEMP3